MKVMSIRQIIKEARELRTDFIKETNKREKLLDTFDELVDKINGKVAKKPRGRNGEIKEDMYDTIA